MGMGNSGIINIMVFLYHRTENVLQRIQWYFYYKGLLAWFYHSTLSK